MKKWLAMLLCVAMLLSFAACAEQGGNSGTDGKGNSVGNKKESPEEYFVWKDTTITGLTEEGKKQKSLVIPAKCTGFKRSAFAGELKLEEISFATDAPLSESMFFECTNLKSVTLSAGQTEIPDNCFAYCESLASVELPSAVKAIGEYAFYECTNLRSINLQETAVETVGERAFQKCTSIVAVKLPATLKAVDEYAFAYCEGMAVLEFQSGIQSIGDYAFHQCEALTKVVLPETLTSLGEHSLSYCTKMAEIYLPASLTEFHVSSFAKTVMADDVVILSVYVKEGSKADTEFDNYNDGQMEKKYY